NTLSGGESQRLKLVRHLSNAKAIGNLFIFDEPTTGLHFDDVAMLLRLFQRLVDGGHSIVVIEHNLEVIKCADWIVDLGPEAGDAGGEVVAVGTPEQVARVEHSHTGKFLRRVLLKTLKALPVMPTQLLATHKFPSGERIDQVAGEGPRKAPRELERSFAYAQDDNVEMARAA